MGLRKVRTVEWRDFFASERKPTNVCVIVDSRKIPAHLKKHGSKYVVAGLTLVLFNGLAGDAFASGSGIDVGARKIYDKLINVAKWVIIVKGGMDCIQGVANGDLQETKKKFMGYVLVYALLFALPWAMDEIETLFDDMDVASTAP